jgi:NDP-sugar pyrophosphorylase family protein
MRALVLAAGEGTRLRPFTLERPKPMVPIGGTPLLEHLVRLLRRHGVAQIAINVHYKPEVIVDHFGDGSRFGVSIVYSWEPRLRGSAGAARQLDWFLTEPFIVLYGDVLTNIDLGELVALHHGRAACATLALYEPDDPSRCGIVELGPEGRVVRFAEKPVTDCVGGAMLANAGIYVLEPEVLHLVPPEGSFDFGNDLFPRLLREKQAVYAYRVPGYILDVGSPERYARAEADLRAGKLQPCQTWKRPAASPSKPGF